MIKGSKVELTPATLADKNRVYEWCFHSEITKSHAGPPDYPNAPIAASEEFFDAESGYADYYFTGERPQDGRGFIILHNGEPVGFVSYSSFHLKKGMAELDIWMNSEANCGKGFGTDALIALGEHLHKTLGIHELIMRPSIKNARANRSYTKAGFIQSDKRPEEYLRSEYVAVFGDGDYGDESALLVKTYKRRSINHAGGTKSQGTRQARRAANPV